MSNELVEQIRSMLKEEINPVHTRLDSIVSKLDRIESRFDGIGNSPDKLDSHFDKINNRLDQSRLNGIEHDLKTLKSDQKQIEVNISAMLEEFIKNITEHYDSKLSVLNKRVFAVESNIERLMK
jgi:predicted  nucleic acid-binding Zn-ribbon protein